MRPEPLPQINISKIVVGGGAAGLFFTIVCVAVFLIGIPLLWVVGPAALVAGCGIALALRSRRPKATGEPWILPAVRKRTTG